MQMRPFTVLSSSVKFCNWIPSPPETGGEPDRRLVLEVIFTNLSRTEKALERTVRLASGLDAKVKLIHVQQVPIAFPMDRPPVDIAFTRAQLVDLVHRAAHCELEVQVQLYLCRDRIRTLFEILNPPSLVILGGRDRWWPTPESRLAKLLSEKGHRVILLSPK